jgi:hypothetical protein
MIPIFVRSWLGKHHRLPSLQTGGQFPVANYLMVETTAAHLSLRQQKSTLANRPSPGQPVWQARDLWSTHIVRVSGC